jgi:hypothetical protein
MNIAEIVKKQTDAILRQQREGPSGGGSALVEGPDGVGTITNPGKTGKDLITHIGSADHDTRYYTKTEMDAHFGRSIVFCFYDTLVIEADILGILPGLNLTILGGKLEVSTAPTGAALICDINKNGDSIFTTQENRPTIADGALSAVIVAPDIVSIIQGDRITLDIDQIGFTTPGEKLTLTLYCNEVIV